MQTIRRVIKSIMNYLSNDESMKAPTLGMKHHYFATYRVGVRTAKQ